jgi:hypothetical protein
MLKTNSLNIWIGIIILSLIIFLLYSNCKNDIEQFAYYELSDEIPQNKIIEQKNNIKIYNFYADWCGY